MNTSSPRAAARDFDAVQFRQALSQFATGVTVITTRLADGSLLLRLTVEQEKSSSTRARDLSPDGAMPAGELVQMIDMIV